MNFSSMHSYYNRIKGLLTQLLSRYKEFNFKMKKKSKVIRFLYFCSKVFFWCLIYYIAVDVNFLWLFGRSPKLSDLNNPQFEIASELYSSDNKLIGRYYDENRTPVKFEEISSLLIKTLIATEDHRFYAHHGIDIPSSVSILWYMAKGKKRGASTITQQLVKNLFKTRTNYSRGLLGHVPLLRTIIYKTKELGNSLKIELFYTKEEILTMYLNTVDFGSNAFGIHTAAKTYFNTAPDKLNASQCAILVGMLKAPTYYSPVANPRNSKVRRDVVLGLLKDQEIITSSQFDSIVKLPLGVNYNPGDESDGNSSYFSYAISRYLKGWLKENGYDIYRDGLKIYTTIDAGLQDYAEAAVKEQVKFMQRGFDTYLGKNDPWQDEQGKPIPGFLDNLIKKGDFYKRLKKHYGDNEDTINYFLHQKRPMKVFSWKGDKDTMFSHVDSLRYFNKFLHASFISMDPGTGNILTWVGDIDFNYFKFDHIKQSKRQPGSTFKAFIYTAAIDNGYAPCDKVIDSPISIKYTEKGEAKTWSPQNVTWVFTGDTISLKHAFARSINSIAVKLTKEFGWKKTIEYAHKMGITTPLEDVPSVSIGSSDVSLYELVNAYCPLVNGGARVEPLLVTRIEDKDGNIIKEYTVQRKQVISEETSFLMTQMLRSGLSEPGATTQALFAYDLFRSKIEFGGKTGTSQNFSDGWFVGVSPKIIGGAWVGGEYRSIHFRSNSQGEGCHTALPIFGRFMEKVLKDKRYNYLKVGFTKPKIKISKSYSCQTKIRRDTIPVDSLVVDSFLIE